MDAIDILISGLYASWINLGLLSYVFYLLASDAPLLCIPPPLSFTPSIVYLPLTNALLYLSLLPLATRDMPSLLTDKGTP